MSSPRRKQKAPESRCRVALLGRPNVGKSTLFNRLTGKKHAIVHDFPGVTRDRREGEGRLVDMALSVIDTPGLEDAAANTLEARMREQSEMALQSVDVCCLLLDAKSGVTAFDEHFARWLHQKDVPVIVVVNKCEANHERDIIYKAEKLGFAQTIGISAEHGEGMGELYNALQPYSYKISAEEKQTDDENSPLKLAVVGRPNVGKSTLINRWLKEERLLTGPEAGITRDAVRIQFTWQGKSLQLMDTAGMRKRGKVTDELEKFAVQDSIQAIRFAEIVIVLLDATSALEQQDISIIHHVLREGRALIIAVNKWDLVEDPKNVTRNLREKIEHSLPLAREVPMVNLSAKTGYQLETLLKTAVAINVQWNQRISSSQLNQWLRDVEERHTPPLASDGRRIRLKYITQVAMRPPRFALFVNKPESLPDSYQRYLLHSLQEVFKFRGVPIRLLLRRNENPYANGEQGEKRKTSLTKNKKLTTEEKTKQRKKTAHAKKKPKAKKS